MRLLFKQRLFSWFDSYDIYDEDGNTVYTVKGQLSWGHCMKIFDAHGNEKKHYFDGSYEYCIICNILWKCRE